MARKSVFVGNPGQIASDCRDYVEAGATHVALYDLVGLTQTVEQALAGIARLVDICRLLKEA